MSFLSPTIRSQQIVNDKLLNGETVYNFGLGSNPFPPHKSLIERLKTSSHMKNYTYPDGDKELKTIIRDKYNTPEYKVKNILVGNGLKELLFVIQMVFKGTILHICPAWVSYSEQTRLLNKKTVEITANYENGYKITPGDLEVGILRCGNEKILLLLNSPNNPTGIFYTDKELYNLSLVINKYRDKMVVFSDEIYKKIVFSGKEVPSISKYVENTICGSSLSKEAACGGWRMGWLTFPDCLDDIYSDAYQAISTMYSCVSQPFIEVAKEFLVNKDNILYAKHMSTIFQQASNAVINTIEDINRVNREKNKDMGEIKVINNTSAWYLFLNVDSFAEILQKNKINDSKDLTQRLMDDINVVAVAGLYFGFSGYYLRISCVDFVIDGDGNISDNAFNHIKEGSRKLASWFYQLYQ